MVRLEVGDTYKSRRRNTIAFALVCGIPVLAASIGAWYWGPVPFWSVPVLLVIGALPVLALLKFSWSAAQVREPGETIFEADSLRHTVSLLGGREFSETQVAGLRVVQPTWDWSGEAERPPNVHVLLTNTHGQSQWHHAWTSSAFTWRVPHSLASHLGVPFERIEIKLDSVEAVNAIVPFEQLANAHNGQFSRLRAAGALLSPPNTPLNPTAPSQP